VFLISAGHSMEHTLCPPELFPDLVASRWPAVPVGKDTLLGRKRNLESLFPQIILKMI